jgi:hypothetical protein
MRGFLCRYALALSAAAFLSCSPVYAVQITYTLTEIGLTDAEHSGVQNRRLSYFEDVNSSGQVLGRAIRTPTYSVNTAGETAWVYDGTNTVALSLNDSEHTSAEGKRESTASRLNEAGQVVGRQTRYGWGEITGYDWETDEYYTYEGVLHLGWSAWLYNGSDTVDLSYTDAEHTRVSDGNRVSAVNNLNDAGMVTGESQRFGTGLVTVTDPITGIETQEIGDVTLGHTAWLYDGSAKTKLGMLDSEHIRDTDGSRSHWVRGMNQAGQIIGDSVRYATGGASLGLTAWYYNGGVTTTMGYTDAEHTRSTDGRRYSKATLLNEAGTAAGQSSRYDAASGSGRGTSAWLYNGTSMTRVGLTDAEHTGTSGSYAGYQSSSVGFLNEAGQAAGGSSRYGGTGRTGSSAWFYNGSTTRNIGLTDVQHTRDTDGWRSSSVQHFTESGKAAGEANRYGVGGISLGDSVWVFDGTTTKVVGLTDTEHTRSTDGFSINEISRFTEGGKAVGRSARYAADGSSIGQSAWADDGTMTVKIGLFDALHTRSTDGYQYNYAAHTNALGQAAGTTDTYYADGRTLGRTAWFFDGDQSISLDGLSSESPWGASFSEVKYLSDDGLVLGTYGVFDEAGNGEDRLFLYSESTGLTDLELLIDDSFDDWNSLAIVLSVEDDGTIYGHGEPATIFSNRSIMVFAATPSQVPVPGAVWLFGSAIGLLGWIRRKSLFVRPAVG